MRDDYDERGEWLGVEWGKETSRASLSVESEMRISHRESEEEAIKLKANLSGEMMTKFIAFMNLNQIRNNLNFFTLSLSFRSLLISCSVYKFVAAVCHSALLCHTIDNRPVLFLPNRQ